MIVNIQNGTGRFDDRVTYFAVYGYDKDPVADPSARWMYLQRDGSLAYCSIGDNAKKNYLHALNERSSFDLSSPLYSAQILFSYGMLPSVFNVIADGNGNPTLQLPSQDSKAADANTLFNTIEFTYNNKGVFFVNNTNVDSFVGPIVTTLVGSATQTRGRMLEGVTRSVIFTEFATAPAPFPNLVWSNAGHPVRIYSASAGTTSTTSLLPADFFDDVIRSLLQNKPALHINYNETYRGAFVGDVLQIKDSTGAQVATRNFGQLLGDANTIFGCGPRVFDQSGSNGAGANIDPVLTAALNRGILTLERNLPACHAAWYPKACASNLYAQKLHACFEQNAVYAFPFDDVCGGSSEISDSAPQSLSVLLDSWS